MFVVNGIEWNLSLVEPYSDNLKRSDNEFVLGVTDNNTKTVYINNRVSDAMFDKILCHELVHCFCFSYGVYMDIEQEEFMADWISRYGDELVYLLDDIMRSFVKSVKVFG